MGVFWHNAAETWIDITNSAANKVLHDVYMYMYKVLHDMFMYMYM